ncbi:MAG: SPOR domain-containing protein [Pseudomonadales bacterium]|nr:SPOR domain-containing protein [Pseudomonadales bacterium]
MSFELDYPEITGFLLMTKTVLAICFFILSISVAAEEISKRYWVVGSFASTASAKKELKRLEYRIRPIRIVVAKSGDKTRYRLLVSDEVYSQHQEALRNFGIEPWQTSMTLGEMGAPMVTAKLGANLNYVLVLAGFRDKNYAEQHAEKLKADTSEPVRVIEASIGNGEYYRVVSGPYDAEIAGVRDQFVLMGIDDAWWLDVPALVTHVPALILTQPEQVVVSEYAPSQIPVVEASVNTIPEGVVLRSPEAGESYIDYCVKKANAAEREQYCRDGEFVPKMVYRVESMGETALFKFCATEATGAERRLYCDNDDLAERGLSQ